MHVIKEFIRFNRRKDDLSQVMKKPSLFRTSTNENCQWMEESNGCEI
jgi:hypothetical protein